MVDLATSPIFNMFHSSQNIHVTTHKQYLD